MTIARRLLLIGGGSCSGKSTFARMLVDHLGERAVRVPPDHYYSDRSGLPLAERRGLNFDEPGAVDHDLLVRHATDLMAGKPIEMPHYDFATHSRVRSTMVEPAALVMIEGIFALCYEPLRELADLRLFVTADRETRRSRRLERDLTRGRDREFTAAQLEATVLPMHDLHLEPTARHADLLVQGTRPFDAVVGVLAAWAFPDSR